MKTHMYATVSVMVVLAAAFGQAGAQAQIGTADSLTLERAVRMAIADHPLIHQAEQGIRGAEARVGVSRSVYYPDVYISGAYTRLEPVASMEIPNVGSFDFYPANNYDFHLGVRQTIYDFGRNTEGVRLAESGRRAAGDNLEIVRSDLAYRTISVFNAILILERTILVIDEQIATLEKHLAVNAKMIQAGTATDFDSLTTEVRIADARNGRVDAVRALEDGEIALRRLTGLPDDRPIFLKGTLEAEPMEIDRDSVIAVAQSGRPELVMSREGEESAKIRLRLASLGNRPSLALSVTSGFKNGYVPDLDKLEANVAAGVQLMVPVFTGFRTRREREEAEAGLRAAEARTADIERRVTAEVEQAIAGVRSSRIKIENSRTQVRQAEASLSRAEARFEAGVVTNLDLLDVQAALSQAKLIHLRSIYEYMLSLNALDRAMGRKVW